MEFEINPQKGSTFRQFRLPDRQKEIQSNSSKIGSNTSKKVNKCSKNLPFGLLITVLKNDKRLQIKHL
jgi:hypothetical protein